MVSLKQQNVNAQNAQSSTGPVTTEGKKVVARNAIKHGIFAKDLVINAGDGREDEMEYHELLAELKINLAPVGRMEMILVEKIAVNYWRMRRLIRYETGEIRERLDNFRESAIQSYYSRQQPELEYYSYDDEISDAEYQEQHNKVSGMRDSGFNLAEEKYALEYVLYYRMDREEPGFAEKDYKVAKKYVNSLSPQMKGKLRKEMLEEAELVLAEMEEVRIWKVKFDRIHKAKSLPVERDIGKIIKYETALERSIFRNLAALKTLQESRVKTEDVNDDFIEVPIYNE